MPKTDVLIVGSGSAGIFAGVWLAIYNIPFTILERRPGPMEIGQADGVQCRTVEIYESFGVGEELVREGYHVREVAFWGPKSSSSSPNSKGIERRSRAPDTEKGLSHMPHVILNQARMNGIMLGVMQREMKKHEVKGKEKGTSGLREGVGRIDYGVEVKSISLDENLGSNPDAHCVRVIAAKDGDEQDQIWEAKYVLGCDGAHSIVRNSLGYKMVGDTTDHVWGVMDIYPLTNFPDIRRKCTIHSNAGALVIIPREGGELVRFYIQLPEGSVAKEVKLEDLQDSARRIFEGYDMHFADTFWWSAYSIGQRLADHFHAHHRVFLTGDACHTHSPKAGQGMNVSLQDGYNIGWKLGQVLSGLSTPGLVETYVAERSKTASDLIEFDREFSRMFSDGTDDESFAKYFVTSGRYTAGLTARYVKSEVVDLDGSGQELAKGVVVGMRMPSAQVVRWCDYKEMHFAKALKSDGRWRIVVFGGDINVHGSREKIGKLTRFLSPMTKRFTPPSKAIDGLIEPILILSSKFAEVEQESIPDYFWPPTGKWKIRDLHKVYVDDEHHNSGHGHAYEKLGIEVARGVVVVVRPDQYVAKVTSLDDFKGIEKFFKGFLLEPNTENGDVRGVRSQL